MFKRIFVPTDGSELSDRAVALAVGLAVPLGATIQTLCVRQPFPYSAVAEPQPAPPPEFFTAQEEAATRHVQAVLDACAAAGVAAEATMVDAAQPWEAIVSHAAAHDCDLLVMGSHGRSGLASLLLGSETEDVIKHTTIPVLVVR
ncbi:MAG: universal stress protein [Pseudomonadota bacterium]|nr:universal stress protein [Pseudomonadota bacterium]